MPQKGTFRLKLGIMTALIVAPVVPEDQSCQALQHGFDLKNKQMVWPEFLFEPKAPVSKESLTNIEVRAFRFDSINVERVRRKLPAIECKRRRIVCRAVTARWIELCVLPSDCVEACVTVAIASALCVHASLQEVLALAYVAVGNKATTETFLLLSISTLRRAGGWRGDVFVVTDRAECIPPSATPVVVPPAPAGSNTTAEKKYGKHFKQRLLQILPLAPHHRYVFYMDMDIFIGSAVGPFLLKAVNDFEASKAAIALLREGTGINGQNDFRRRLRLYHGGMFLVSRGVSSLACLQHWSVWYMSELGADQPQLTKSVKAGACNVSFLEQNSYAQPTNVSAGTYWTFNHFTRTGRMAGQHGLLNEHFSLAGEVLLGLDRELAKCWWNVSSPLCEA
eukprot:6211002-Pleurochrysis_carterae.AAC.1